MKGMMKKFLSSLRVLYLGEALLITLMVIFFLFGLYYSVDSSMVNKNSSIEYNNIKKFEEGNTVLLYDNMEYPINNEGLIFTRVDSSYRYSKESGYLVVPISRRVVYFRYGLLSMLYIGVYAISKGLRRKGYRYVGSVLGLVIFFYMLAVTLVMDNGYFGKNLLIYLLFSVTFIVECICLIIRVVKYRE